MITDTAIEDVQKNIPDSWPDEQKEKLSASFSDLLTEAQKKPIGTECSSVYNSDMEIIATSSGKIGSTTIPDQSFPYIAMHNHPDGFTFSDIDIERFIDRPNLEVLFAVGNDGSVYMIRKTETYNASDFIHAYADSYVRNLSHFQSVEEANYFISEFLKGIEKYGIEYDEKRS